MLMTYLRVLEAHGWVRVLVDSHIRFFAHPSHPDDRIQVFDGWWSHHHFDGMSWLTHARAHGVVEDTASLDTYLAQLFASGSR